MAESTTNKNKRIEGGGIATLAVLGIALAGGVGGIAHEVTKDNDISPVAQQPDKQKPAPEPRPTRKENCKTVEGVLRVVGFNKQQAIAVEDADDMAPPPDGKIPRMLHERENNANVTKMELRWKPDINDELTYNDRTEVYIAANHHFYPNPQIEHGEMLDKDDTVTGHAYNTGPDMIGQVVMIGTFQKCA